jgi:hypothetical protein
MALMTAVVHTPTFLIVSAAKETGTNANEKIIVTVIASPKGAAISSLLGIASSLRSSQ